MPDDADLNEAQAQLRTATRQGLDFAVELERGPAPPPIHWRPLRRCERAGRLLPRGEGGSDDPLEHGAGL